MFDDELAGDEAVDEAVIAADLLDGLFVDGCALCTDAEAFIEAKPEGLRLGFLVV